MCEFLICVVESMIPVYLSGRLSECLVSLADYLAVVREVGQLFERAAKIFTQLLV